MESMYHCQAEILPRVGVHEFTQIKYGICIRAGPDHRHAQQPSGRWSEDSVCPEAGGGDDPRAPPAAVPDIAGRIVAGMRSMQDGVFRAKVRVLISALRRTPSAHLRALMRAELQSPVTDRQKNSRVWPRPILTAIAAEDPSVAWVETPWRKHGT